MGLFGKKEEIPKIPVAPTLPELPKIEAAPGLPELPSFPPHPKNNNFNQDMVKSAVTDTSSLGNKILEHPKPHSKEILKEEESVIPKPPVKESVPSLPKTPSPIKDLKSEHNINEPIFVRIDKFQSSQKNFETIKDKVREIEAVLRKIKDIKSQEEEELKGWSEDIEKLKSRLTEIDNEIFNQI
jgi:hypothetical protein